MKGAIDGRMDIWRRPSDRNNGVLRWMIPRASTCLRTSPALSVFTRVRMVPK